MRSLVRLFCTLSAFLSLTVTLFAPQALGQMKAEKTHRSKGAINAITPSGTTKIALYHAGSTQELADVQNKLIATGLFSQVDGFTLIACDNYVRPLPTLAQLQQYDAVMVWSGCGYPEGDALGNVLADYVDAGGGVVLAKFVFSAGLAGRLLSGGYFPFTTGGSTTAGHQTLVKDIPSHPILQDVNSFDGGFSYRAVLSLTDGAQQVARWTDNLPLVATKKNTAGQVVGLNMFPPSNSVSPYYWSTSTDGARLMANALLFARRLPPMPVTGDVIISEFRASGPAGSRDEFVELYNTADTSFTVAANDGSAGWALATSDGTVRFVIPNGTVIPARRHFLALNANCSLINYPGGVGTNTTGDLISEGGNSPLSSYAADIPENTGIALFSTATAANFNTGSRLDSVGPTTETNALYKEGAGYTALASAIGFEYSFLRDLTSGLPKDSGDNASDFQLVATDPVLFGNNSRLGAPGPENLSSPVQRNDTIKGSLIDPNCPGFGTATSACARVRTGAGANPTNAAYGTLLLRRRFTNKTGVNVTRLRFRVTNITTYPEAGAADLRVLGGSGNFSASVPMGGETVYRLTLETPPGQPNGGGHNSTLSASSVTLNTPLIPNNWINVEFILGVQQQGYFRFLINVEALP